MDLQLKGVYKKVYILLFCSLLPYSMFKGRGATDGNGFLAAS